MPLQRLRACLAPRSEVSLGSQTRARRERGGDVAERAVERRGSPISVRQVKVCISENSGTP